jgi:alpha-mannosidase
MSRSSVSSTGWNISVRVLLIFILGASFQETRLSGEEGRAGLSAGLSIYVVPHSHQALEWFWTYDQSKVLAIKILRHALEILKKDPHYAFTQDYMVFLKTFWESLPNSDQNFLRRAAQEGRFEIATGMYVQPNMAEPDFESLTRQLLLAKRWEEETFGTKVLTSWNIDSYGQPIQMPQLFRKAGIPYLVFMRDVPPPLQASVKSPFHWESPDGSKVLSYWLSTTYAINTQDPGELASQLKTLVKHNVEGNDKIMLPWGYDFYVPTQTSHDIEQLIRKAAAQIGIRIESVVLTTPSHYFKEVERSGVRLPTYHFDFNPPLLTGDLRGLYGERPAIKLDERRAEDILESSEKFCAITGSFGHLYPTEQLRWGWERLLFSQDHDSMPGSHTDENDERIMSRYGGAIEAGRSALEDALYWLSRQIDTSNGGDFPFLVFNALSYPRSEVVRYSPCLMLRFGGEANNFSIVDQRGDRIPFRLISTSRWLEGGTPNMAVVEFLADEVPAMGYRVYRIEKAEGSAEAPQWHVASGEISNRFFILRFDTSKGTIASLVDRRDGEELLDTRQYGGNELVLEEEKDPEVEGYTHFTGHEIRTGEIRPESLTEINDALGTRVRIQRPFLGGRLIQDIAIYKELPRIDLTTRLVNFPGHDGMLTVVFPLRGNANKKTYYETNDAVTMRPDGIYAAQTWVDLEGRTDGLSILNRGMGGLQTERGVVRLILLRSINNYRGYYAPKASEAGSHEFEYSLYPHPGGWAESGVIDQAHSFNSPLRIVTTDSHQGSLPSEHSFLSVETGNFQVTALKRAEQGKDLILRGYETQGKVERVRLHLGFPVQEAWLADCLEQRGKEIAVREGKVEFDCQPFEFVTVRLRLVG